MPRIFADRIEMTFNGHTFPVERVMYSERPAEAPEPAPTEAFTPGPPPEPGTYANTFSGEATGAIPTSSFNELVETMRQLTAAEVRLPPRAMIVSPEMAAALATVDAAMPGAAPGARPVAGRLGIDIVVDENIPAGRAYAVPADLARFGVTPPRIQPADFEHFMTEAGRNAGSYAESMLHSAIRDAAIARAGDQLRDTLRRGMLDVIGPLPPPEHESSRCMPTMTWDQVPDSRSSHNALGSATAVPWLLQRVAPSLEDRWRRFLDEIRDSVPAALRFRYRLTFTFERELERLVVALRLNGRVFEQSYAARALEEMSCDEERFDIVSRDIRHVVAMALATDDRFTAAGDALDRYAEALGLRRQALTPQAVFTSNGIAGHSPGRLESDDELRARCRNAMTQRVEPHDLEITASPNWVGRIDRPVAPRIMPAAAFDNVIRIDSFEIVIDALSA